MMKYYCNIVPMKVDLKKKNYVEELTLAQLWKARRAQEKLAKSDYQSPKVERKEAA